MRAHQNISTLISENFHRRYFGVIVAKALDRLWIFEVEELRRWLVRATCHFEVVRTHPRYVDLAVVGQLRQFIRNYLLIYLAQD